MGGSVELPENLLEQSVLDHGYVKYIRHMGDDELIVETARMSTDGAFRGWESDQPMLDYMYRHHHTSPFEFGSLIVEVQAPIMVYRQWHRHRTQTYNEMSGRYTELPDLCYVPEPDRIQKQSTINKQGSGEPFSMDEQLDYVADMREEQAIMRGRYGDRIRDGVSKELARINIPVSQYSRMRAVANLHNWLNFLRLRMDEHAQWEIRQYAYAIAKLVAHLWPRTYGLFEEYTLFGVSFSSSEKYLLRQSVLGMSVDERYRFLAHAEECLGKSKFREFKEKVWDR
jgi:thymidylate synthase (FAD)